MCGHRTGFAEGHADGFLGRVLLHPVDVLGQSVDSGRRVGRTTTGHGRTNRCALVSSHADAPLVNRQTVGDTDVGCTGHRQPRVGKTPAQRWVFLAVVHVAINRLAVDVLDVFGEEGGDVFVSAPVQRHAQVIAVFGFELVFQVSARKQICAEPVQVGELLRGQLVELAIGCRGEAGTDEVFDVQTRVGVFLACAGHVVGEVQNFAVTVVGTDQVGVRNPAVIDGLARLHGGLQLLNHVTLLDQVVLDLDAGDFFKRLGQSLGLVLMGGDGLGDHRNFFHPFGLQFLGCVDEPFHLFQLLFLAQGRGLEFAVNPLLGRCFVGPCAVSQRAGDRDANRCVPQFHVVSPRLMCPLTLCCHDSRGHRADPMNIQN